VQRTKPSVWVPNLGSIDPNYGRLWSDCVSLVPFWTPGETDNLSAFDFGQRKLLTSDSGVDGFPVATPYGSGYEFDDPNDGDGLNVMSHAEYGRWFAGSSNATFWMVGAYRTDYSGLRGRGKGDGTTVQDVGLGTTNGNAARFECRIGSSDIDISSAISASTYYQWFGVVRDGVAELWVVDGSDLSLVASNSSEAGSTIGSTASSQDLALGNVGAGESDNARAWNGPLVVAGAWTRALSEPDMRLLQHDPFGMVRPALWPVVPFSVVLTVSLYATGDGTVASVVDEVDGTTTIYTSVDDDPDSPSDSDYMNNTAETASIFHELTDMPVGFGTASSGTMLVRTRGQNWSDHTMLLYAELFQSDESTSLSDEVHVGTADADGSFANETEVTFTGLVAGSKSVWDGARVRFRWVASGFDSGFDGGFS